MTGQLVGKETDQNHIFKKDWTKNSKEWTKIPWDWTNFFLSPNKMRNRPDNWLTKRLTKTTWTGLQTKVRWRFCKILLPSQNIWTLSGTNSVKLLSVDGLEFWNAEKIKSAFLSLYDLVFSLELKFRNINGFQFFTYFWNIIRIFKGGRISISIL